MDIIKVSSKSISQKVAGSIANSFREGSKGCRRLFRKV